MAPCGVARDVRQDTVRIVGQDMEKVAMRAILSLRIQKSPA